MKIKRYIILFLLSTLTGVVYSQINTKELLADTIYRSLSVQQADSLIQANQANSEFVILDVRSASEYAGGHLANAVNIDYYSSSFSTDIGNLDHNKIYLLYCYGGTRSTATYNMMQSMHFRELYNMLGGINAWITAGYPTVTGTTGIACADELKIEVYPNPATDMVFIKMPYGVYTVSLVNQTGSTVVSELSNSDLSIDLSLLSKGVYYLIITSENKPQQKRIVIKE